ncbi:hypothetical protein BLA24_28035 [Streptomyces cinnamoneus]|uniref:ATP-binding protein n=1 Tax=Streptomyces cinnamoneus TaxID=53446 RepID=A0A2G1XCM0_STRCJ|nr:hypothetical protein [Streptomyces cinnamoneus]PHQ48909.1 hypothetical protein BLA24_28035 [Streptomyces cinnamoneus]PPT14442.1 hypothetical protein CYQ11_17605 [Streptomyces cinnamoneus]
MHSKTMAATLLAGTAVLGTAGAAAADTPVDGAVKTVTGIVQNLPAGAPDLLGHGLATPTQKESKTKTLPAKVGQEHGASLPGAELLGGLPVGTGAVTGAVPGGMPALG